MLKEKQQVSQTLTVYPDAIKINGNLIFITGLDRQTSQQETAILATRTPAELRQFEDLAAPTQWKVRGELQPLSPPTNENQYDNRLYNHQHHIYNQLKITKLEQIKKLNSNSLLSLIHGLRARLKNYFANLPQPLASYANQLIIGNNDGNANELMADVKRLGLIHLFCISGMHVVLLVALIRKGLIYLWWDREVIDWVLIVTLPGYLIIGGGATSLRRAVIMAELGLLQHYLPIDKLDAWALSLIIGLVIDPLLLLTLGGQLTYLLSFMLQVMPKGLASFKQSLLMNLISLPSLLTHVYEFHLLSLVASFIVIPIFSVLIFPAVLVATACYKFLPLISNGVNYGLVIFQRCLSWLAQFPGMINFGKPPLLVGISLFILTMIALAQPQFLKWWRILILAYLGCLVLIHFPLTGEVVFADIGQGDSIIIREPFNRRVMMIDTGGKVSFQRPRWMTVKTSHNDAERVTVNYLKSKGISKIDKLYLTHHDADHIGYLPTILENFEVKQVIVPAGMEKQPAFTNKIATSLQSGIKISPVTDQTAEQSSLTVLHPFVSGEAKNEDSLVLAGKYGRLRFVFTGDLDQNGEKQVLAKYPQLKADILKLGHHGSKTASAPEFLAQLAPRYGIISAGRLNRYHHPDPITVKNLHQQQITPLSTQQYGMIKYVYFANHDRIITTLTGDEMKWILPNCLTN